MNTVKTRRKAIDGNADTIIRQTTVKNLPLASSVAGGRDEERRYDKANYRQEFPQPILMLFKYLAQFPMPSGRLTWAANVPNAQSRA